ncbi:SHOCT domain-containing protein [Haladaptatus sp. CMAA 1911]|uniref:SHOCT domain-containing protein n=1 Tax=unclassified Haladaptatus TaxID=2622732 RepID=UPI0037540038
MPTTDYTMALHKNKWLWVSMLGLLLSGGLLLVVVGYLALVVYMGMVSGTPIVDSLLNIAVPTIITVAVLVVIFTLSSVGALWTIAQNASLPRSTRLGKLVEHLERKYSPLGPTGLSDTLTPPEPSAEEQTERALANLKQQYVNGDITEREFEQKVDRLVSNDSIDEVRARRERQRVVEET